MINAVLKRGANLRRVLSAAVLAALLGTTMSTVAYADEADAKRLLKNMSDYLAAQSAYSFEYDSVLGVVTDEGQGLELASSGEVKLKRPDKLYATRAGGFVNLETFFDGKTFTIFGKDANIYTQIEAPDSIDKLIDELVLKYNLPLPASDLLHTGAYAALMADVIDVKDLGSGVINGIECDYLAFRTEEVDWQIWIAQGDDPYPCRFVITSTQIEGQPQYSVQLRNWKRGMMAKLGDGGFSFKNKTDAGKVDLAELQGGLPQNFTSESGDEQ
jgi:hypothetical protein